MRTQTLRAIELQRLCKVPGFHSLPLELLHFVQAIKYSLGQWEKSKRLILLPSCSGAHLGYERCRVKSLLQRWFNYLYKVEQLQQGGCMCQQAWWPSPALHKTSSLLTQCRDLMQVFSLPGKGFLLALWYVNFSFLLPELGQGALQQYSGLRLFAEDPLPSNS